MIWDSSDHRDYRIVAYTRWRYIWNYESLEARAGVYVFANAKLSVVYVGKAGAGRMIVEIESAFRRKKDRGATKVKALYTNSDDKAKTLERNLIDKYHPPNNIV